MIVGVLVYRALDSKASTMFCTAGQVVFIHLKQVDKTGPTTTISPPAIGGRIAKAPL